MSRQSLRRDPQGWQIEDDDAAEATLRVIEVLGLVFAHMVLHRISHWRFLGSDTGLALRGLGTVAGRLATSRLAWLSGIDHAGNPMLDPSASRDDQIAGEHMRAVLNWLIEWDPANLDAPPTFRWPRPVPPPSVLIALDELWAAALYFDRRAQAQGTTGPGERRRITRETTRRRSS